MGEPGWIREAETDGRLVLAAGGGWAVAGVTAIESAGNLQFALTGHIMSEMISI